jgi:hypothetical protein
MHAVLIEVDVSQLDREAGLKNLRQEVVPGVSRAPGFKGRLLAEVRPPRTRSGHPWCCSTPRQTPRLLRARSQWGAQ